MRMQVIVWSIYFAHNAYTFFHALKHVYRCSCMWVIFSVYHIETYYLGFTFWHQTRKLFRGQLKEASGCGNFSLHWRPVGDLLLLSLLLWSGCWLFDTFPISSLTYSPFPLWHIPHFHSQFYRYSNNIN